MTILMMKLNVKDQNNTFLNSVTNITDAFQKLERMFIEKNNERERCKQTE